MRQGGSPVRAFFLDRRFTANVLVLLQVFQQGFRGPPVAGGIPVVVMCPRRVAQLGGLAVDDVTLVNDGDASLRGHFVHAGKRTAPPAVHSVCRQDDQRRAVAHSAVLELIQSEGREGEGFLVE